MADNYFGITDTGRQRSNNEDTFIAQPVMNGKFIAAGVIDGVGGYSGGEVAARIAHDVILNHLKAPVIDVITSMKEALAAANEAIYAEKKVSKDYGQMACVLTLALVDIPNNKFYYAHVGDTRLYLFRDNSLVKITHDHSFVGFLEDSGRLTEEAAMKHPKRNEINKALGFDSQLRASDYIETGESPFLPGDNLLLCSDGLSDMIGVQPMTAVLLADRSLSTKGKALIQAANEAGGRDNITVVLVKNNKTPVKLKATKPTSAKNNVMQSDELRPEIKHDSTEKQVYPVKKRSSLVPLLSVLCLLLLGALVWLLYQNYQNKKQRDQEVQNTVVVKERNEQEKLLADSIKGSKTNEVFVLHQADTPPVVITDSIIINRDSLHIIGNGVTLVSDSAYKGAAITLSGNCKYLLLDSMTIENFDIGVLANNQALHLKNVQFKNCRIPVQYNLRFPDRPVLNGKFADTVFYNSEFNQQ